LERAGFEGEQLPQVQSATVDTLVADSGRGQEEVALELQGIQQQIQQLAIEAAERLAAIERLASQERRLLEAAQHCPRTETAVLLTGWAPATEAPVVERRLREITAGRCIWANATAEDAAGEPVPVLLRHPRLLRPFEMLVAAYGLPRYQELEPTLFVALSFVLMFGMMFGDAGHGLVLALGGLLALRRGKTTRLRDAGVLLLFAGFSSMIFGVVYGSYFGLNQLKHYALWHDPLEGDAMALMYATMGFGVVMISLGMILNMINRFRAGDLVGGFLGQFGVAGALFYWGMLALATRFAEFEAHGMTGPLLLFCLALPIAGWMLKGPLEYVLHRRAHKPVEPAAGGGLFAACAESVVEAFEACLSYLANTISFVRLAAYAMSHAALLVATYMMAAEVRSASVAGSLLVIVLGNLVAMVLEGVIACVQALRLEYYEFFGKFFSGEGQPFKPFRLVEVN
jgi:V/A-type H+-transporting ATPase subunit I